MSNYTVGANQTHYYSEGDLTCRCPKCFNNSITPIGILSINGVQHQASKCNNCNLLFSGVDGGIASMIEEAKSNFNTGNVGFSHGYAPVGSASILNGSGGNIANGTITVSTNGSGPLDTKLDYNTQSKLDQMNSNLSCIYTTLQSLVNEIMNLSNQNAQLMNKVQSDPLISIKKAVSEFNLK